MDFWNHITGYDFIGLCETWLEEEGWNRIKEKLSGSHKWMSFYASRVSKKERAESDIVIGIRRGIRKKMNQIQ